VLPNKSVEKIEEDKITLSERSDGQSTHQFDVPADIVILTSGTETNPLVKALDVEKSNFGKIIVDKNLKVKSCINIYAAGDCAQIDGVLLPSTAQVAMQQAQVLAKNIAIECSSSSNKKLDSFQYMPLGEMLTLGFKEASVSGLSGLVQIDGPAAALARRIVYAIRMPTPTQTINALLYAGVSTASKIAASLRDELKP
jgi:demethylphylloquinone reductase